MDRPLTLPHRCQYYGVTDNEQRKSPRTAMRLDDMDEGGGSIDEQDDPDERAGEQASVAETQERELRLKRLGITGEQIKHGAAKALGLSQTSSESSQSGRDSTSGSGSTSPTAEPITAPPAAERNHTYTQLFACAEHRG